MSLDAELLQSDIRSEPASQPLSLKPLGVETVASASIVPQLGSPMDPDSISVSAPNGTPPPPTGQLLEDVRMAEESSVPTPPSPPVPVEALVTNGLNGVNGHHPNGVLENDDDIPHHPDSPLDSFHHGTEPPVSPTPTPGSMIMEDIDGGVIEPPAKRARKLSDADQASAHATPTPTSIAEDAPMVDIPTYSQDLNGDATTKAEADTTPTVTPVIPPTPVAGSSSGGPLEPTLISPGQYRFLMSTLRNLKKNKDAIPFLYPVDHVKLNIPHYPTIIRQPMDMSTVEGKLLASNPIKPDPDVTKPRYRTTDDFVADMRLIFANCIAFNGADHAVALMGRRVESILDRQLKNLPASEPPKPIAAAPKKASPPPSPPPPPPKKVPARRASTSVPTIRRSESGNTGEANGRPKREIHPPPTKELPYAEGPRKVRRRKTKKDDGTYDQLKFCGKLLGELNKKQYANIAYPFYEPVDWQALDLPMYPKVVKKPMDLYTMRKKLDGGEYATVKNFYDDFRLMIKNCFLFNPHGTPVQHAGAELERVFNEKWRHLPPLREVPPTDDEEEADEESDDEEKKRMINMLETQMQTMQQNLETLKSAKEKKKSAKRGSFSKSTPAAGSSKMRPPPNKKGKPKKNGGVLDNDVLTFEQKKELSETIQVLEGTKLERVIQIIHEGVPEIRDSQEEIELDIDSLPASVLTKLYNFVIRPLKPQGPKRNRGVTTGTGTGGLKRKSMDEDEQSERIRKLEDRLRSFDRADGTSAGGAMANSSDSSSDSDSSGSESD